MSAARHGRRAVVVQAPQAWPFEPYVTEDGLGSGQSSRLVLFEGYANAASDGVVTAREATPHVAQGWAHLPPSALSPREIVFSIGASRFFGLFIDEVSQIMLTIPLYMPIVKTLALDPIWFGTLMMICMVIGALSPPFGLQLFVMMGVGPKGTTLGDVSWAAAPYMASQVVMVGLIIAFPSITTILSNMMQ